MGMVHQPVEDVVAEGGIVDQRYRQRDARGSGAGATGARGRQPAKRHTDKGYDYRRCHDACLQSGIQHRISRKSVESKHRLGRHRWAVERTFAWLARYRCLAIRYERRVAMAARNCWVHPNADRRSRLAAPSLPLLEKTDLPTIQILNGHERARTADDDATSEPFDQRALSTLLTPIIRVLQRWTALAVARVRDRSKHSPT